MKLSRLIFAAGLLLILAYPAVAAIKDTDLDGLSDRSEIDIYHTNPNLFDTDGDGASDGQEILDGTNPLDPKSSRIASLVAPDRGMLPDRTKYAWYVGRTAGILAFVLLTIVVVHGLVISSRAFFRTYSPAVALEVHRFLSWTALAMVGLHIGALTFDGFFKLTWFEAVVPFSMHRPFRTVLGFDTGLAAAIGSVALYLIIVLILTSEFRAKMSSKVWRTIHYSSFASYGLFVAHGFMSGTDSREWWMRDVYIGSVSIVAVMILIRLFFRNRLQRIRAKQLSQQATDIPPVPAA